MRFVLSLCVVAASFVFLCGQAQADKETKADKADKDAKVTLTGNITCAKCELGESKSCYTVIVADKKTYWFDEASSKKYHGDICKAGKKGTVTGEVAEKNGKNWIKVASLEWAK